jgi:hypothetical protein
LVWVAHPNFDVSTSKPSLPNGYGVTSTQHGWPGCGAAAVPGSVVCAHSASAACAGADATSRQAAQAKTNRPEKRMDGRTRTERPTLARHSDTRKPYYTCHSRGL